MPLSRSGTLFRTPIGIAAALPVMAALAIGLTIWWLHVDAIADAAIDAGNLATILSEQTDRSVQSINLMLDEIQECIAKLGATAPSKFRRRLHNTDFYGLLLARMAHLPQATFIAVVDNKGRILVPSIAGRRRRPALPTAPILSLSSRT